MTPLDDLKPLLPEIDAPAWERLARLCELVRAWNERINLISRKDIENFERHHLAPCLAAVKWLKPGAGARIMDGGTGGGMPGLPLAACFPQAQFVLVDSVGKKLRAVQAMADELGLRNLSVLHARMETVPGQFDFVLGRAVATLPVFAGWIRGRLRPGRAHGVQNGLIYWKGGDLEAEYAELGARPAQAFRLEDLLQDSYFADKYILHFPAEALRRARPAAPGSGRPTQTP